MEKSKPFWLEEPSPDQTSVRFCCPHCFIWVRNRELEDHLNTAHPQIVEPPAQGKGKIKQ